MGGFVAAVPRGAPATPELIERVIAASRDRAPDGVRHVVTPEGVLLVQCMFANTPESVGEQLPLSDPSGRVWIVKRGHLNNIEELRGQLRDRLGPDARVHTDAEVMLAAYLAWGGDMAGRIHGEFTLAIWDGRDHSLFVLRDHLGLRGCYTHDGPDWYVAASEPGQVLPFPGVSDDLDETALVDYMSGSMVDRTRTFYSGIGRPMPSTAVTVRGHHVDEVPYWVPTACRKKATGRPDKAAYETLATFEAAMRSAMRSPTAVVCDLSGGLDSSAVLGMAAKLRRDEPEATPAVIAHSMLYPGLDCDETQYIAAMLDKWPVPWHGFDYLNATCAPDDRDDLMRSTAFLVGVRAPGMRARDYWMAASGARVQLSGHVGDELFCSAPLPLNRGARPKGELWPYVWWASKRSMRILGGRVRRELLRPHVPHAVISGYLRLRSRGPDTVEYLTPKGVAIRDRLQEVPSPLDSQTSRLVDGLWGPGDLFGQGISDALTLRYGYEVRRPFGDLRLLELVSRQPLLFHRWEGRWRSLQKQAFASLYPPAVEARADKAEFTASYLMALRVEGVSPALLDLGLLDPSWSARITHHPVLGATEGPTAASPWGICAVDELSRWTQAVHDGGDGVDCA